jgi:hypothetical protein
VKTPTRLVAYGLGLVTVFGAALGVGRLAGPVAVETAAGAAPGSGVATGTEEPGVPGGLQVSQRGYTLQLSAATAMAGRSPLSFSVVGPDGRPVTAYEVTHEKQLHLIVVQRDLSGYAHLHPTMDAAGTWTSPVDLRPGSYRVFADFQPAGESESLTLGSDLTVAGSARPATLPEPARESVVDDYTVTIDGTLTAGAMSRLSFDVSRAGRPVADLQPYLGAAGHLVALRAGDLAYLHVHPAGNGLSFDIEVPSPGTYRLYLDFKHGGVVRTAEFTAVARAGASPAPPAPTGGGHGDDDGHGE